MYEHKLHSQKNALLAKIALYALLIYLLFSAHHWVASRFKAFWGHLLKADEFLLSMREITDPFCKRNSGIFLAWLCSSILAFEQSQHNIWEFIKWFISDIYDLVLWQEHFLFNGKDRVSSGACSTEGSNSVGLKADMPSGNVDPWKRAAGINKSVRSNKTNGDGNLCFECRLWNCIFFYSTSPFIFAELWDIYIYLLRERVEDATFFTRK